jgi:hypothetical protein
MVNAIATFGVPLLPPVMRIYRLAVLYRHFEPQLVIASNPWPESCHDELCFDSFAYAIRPRSSLLYMT